MRLINVETYAISSFVGDAIPEYAILSHTWGRDEVLLQDMLASDSGLAVARRKRGFRKIEYCCRQARRDGWHFVWVDTCCIDKESSAELSEAINSMYRWYSDAMSCYSYLEDAELRSEAQFAELLIQPRSRLLGHAGRPLPRWFTRGWTLQELIAPFDVTFFAADWTNIGTKRSLAGPLSQATGIPASVLTHTADLYKVSVASRLRWSANRFTTREEDLAYSLLGIFNVNIPLMYGEGPRAFLRLQKEILQATNDHTMFLWGLLTDAQYQATIGMRKGEKLTGLIAQSPRDFHRIGFSDQIESLRFTDYPTMSATGLRLNLRLIKLSAGEIPTLDQFLPPEDMKRVYVGALNCTQPYSRGESAWENEQATVILMRLTPQDSPATVLEFARIPLQSPPVSRDLARTWPTTQCHIPATRTKEDYFHNDLRLLKRSHLKYELLGRLPAAVDPIFTPFFGLSQGTFYIHRVKIFNHPKQPTLTLVYGLKAGKVFCEVSAGEGDNEFLPDLDYDYRRRDNRGELHWVKTFDRVGPVAECSRELHGMRVSCRITSRPARKSDLGRYSTLAAAVDFIVFTPWLLLEILDASQVPLIEEAAQSTRQATLGMVRRPDISVIGSVPHKNAPIEMNEMRQSLSRMPASQDFALLANISMSSGLIYPGADPEPSMATQPAVSRSRIS
jgi:hypothetical protein